MPEEPIPRDFEGFKTLLASRREDLPRRLQQVAAFAVDHPDEVAFGTAASIARLADVQPSTLVRFAKAIGYAGFSDLQGVFRNRLRDRWPDYEERLFTRDQLRDQLHLIASRQGLDGSLTHEVLFLREIGLRGKRRRDRRWRPGCVPRAPRCPDSS